jgi:hypothetical protein
MDVRFFNGLDARRAKDWPTDVQQEFGLFYVPATTQTNQ